jgi:putative NIF3 family GTP cyclohydrolase 1 type 2
MKLFKFIEEIENLIPQTGTESFPKVLIKAKEGIDSIKSIGFTLNFSTQNIIKAKEMGCELLLVHHGPPNYDNWNSPTTKKKIKLLKDSGLSLLTLPFCLDVSEFGPNAQFPDITKLKTVSIEVPFNAGSASKIRNSTSKLVKPIKHVYLISALTNYNSSHILVYGNIKEIYKNVVISAGGGFQTEIIEELNPEVYISGDINIRALRLASELGTVIIALTHQSMEAKAIPIIAKKLSNKLNITIKPILENDFILQDFIAKID